MDVSCPQCGNPKLDVDEANSVVYCQKCGFSVKVDPQTGNVTPLSPGGPAGPTGGMAPPAAYQQKTILGLDGLTFFMLGTAVALLLTFLFDWNLLYLLIAEILLFLVYWRYR